MAAPMQVFSFEVIPTDRRDVDADGRLDRFKTDLEDNLETMGARIDTIQDNSDNAEITISFNGGVTKAQLAAANVSIVRTLDSLKLECRPVTPLAADG